MKSDVYLAKIGQIDKLKGPNLHVIVNVDSDQPFHYAPGQYVDVMLADEKRRTFSIASSPECGNRLEFYLRDVEGGALEALLCKHLNEQSAVKVTAPQGDYVFDLASPKRLVFLAGGTGFAPVKSMLEYGIQHGLKRCVALYWGARTQDEFYFNETLNQWVREHAWFHYTPVLSDEMWEGRTGYVHEAFLNDEADLSDIEVYASGSPQMIKAVYHALLARGLDEADFYSDILAYAKTL